MNAKPAFITEIHAYVTDMTGFAPTEIGAGATRADGYLAAAIGRAEKAAARITSGRVHPASPVGLRYAKTFPALIADEVDRWMAATIGDKGFGPA